MQFGAAGIFRRSSIGGPTSDIDFASFVPDCVRLDCCFIDAAAGSPSSMASMGRYSLVWLSTGHYDFYHHITLCCGASECGQFLLFFFILLLLLQDCYRLLTGQCHIFIFFF